MPTDADRIDAIRWLADRMGLEPDPEEGVWLATNMGKVLRPPEHLNDVLAEILNDRLAWAAECEEFGCHDPLSDPTA